MAAGQPSELIDSHVSVNQCHRAVDALLKHARAAEKKREESELLPGKEQHVWLVLAVKQMHPEKKLKPFKIPIVHPLIDPRTTPVCLITKDPQREYKDLIASHNIKFISRVVGIEKLKGKFKPFEARRMLLQENGMFLADERVVPLLPKLLGRKFFEAKKQPIPVNLTRKDLKGELERAISSTYMHQNNGTCSSIKIGTLSQTPAQILANLTSALPAIVKRVHDGWDNVQSFQLKTSTSVSLPVWNCNLEDADGGRWDGLVASESLSDNEEESEEEGSGEEPGSSGGEKDEEGSDADMVVEAPPPSKPKAAKKRPAEEEELQPAKKAKGTPNKKTGTKIAPGAAPASKPTSKSIATTVTVSAASKDGKAVVRQNKTKTTVTSTASPSEPVPANVVEIAQSASVAMKPKKARLSKTGPVTVPLLAPAPEALVELGPPAKSGKAGHLKKGKVSSDEPAHTAGVPTPATASVAAAGTDGNTDRKKLRRKKEKDVSGAAEIGTPAAPSVKATALPRDAAPPSLTSAAISRETASASPPKLAKPHANKSRGIPNSFTTIAVTPPPITATSSTTIPSAASFSKEEMKQKRGAAGGERKKVKAVKARAGKSAKEALLGKK